MARNRRKPRTGRSSDRQDRRVPDVSIADHGVIGDRYTAALVGLDGSIDWYCAPRFDSPSVFGRLLDPRGGHASVSVDAKRVNARQQYLPATNVLMTRFMTREGVAELLDFMPLDHARSTPPLHRIVRRIRVLRGRLRLQFDCEPAFDYGRDPHTTKPTRLGCRFTSSSVTLALDSSEDLRLTKKAARARFELSEGESAHFVLRTLPEKRGDRDALGPRDVEQMLQRTITYWRQWSSKCTYQGRWREQVLRSALALKLLTYEPTGAIAAAATASLPERLGGARNWDYRYGWLRDTSFVVHALLEIGFAEEAGEFVEWLLSCLENCDPEKALMPLYTIDAARVPKEQVLEHWAGHAGSSPVRIGNAASSHLQLDLYGAVLDALWSYEEGGARITHLLWTRIVRLVDWVCSNWMTPDRGIWEIRSEPRHHTFSKVMCWVAIDRGLRIARRRGLPCDRLRWEQTRDEIYEAVMTRGWSESRQSFAGSFDGEDLDASLLLMPTLGIVAPKDPRMRKTMRAIERDLGPGFMLRRYRLDEVDDGVPGREGSFMPCGFFLVEALTRAGQVSEARLAFETLLGFTNHVGLCGEQISDSGDVAGNFPQALTHLALIRAAVDLDRALGRGA